MNIARNFTFLHGGGQGGWVWEKTIAALHAQAPRSATLALDVPGCGKKTARSTTHLDNKTIAEDLLQDIEHTGLHRTVLVGHSQAGQILPFMAALRPGLFQHLVYVSCSLPLPGQSVLAMMSTGRHGEREDEVGYPFDFDLTEIRQRYPELFCNDMTSEQSEPFLARLGPDQWPMKTYEFTDWPAKPPPVRASYILCERDRILPAQWQLIFARRLGASGILRIDAGHQVMMTRPDDLAAILLQIARA